MNPVDKLLNTITMYRLVLYCLSILAAVAILFGFLGWLPFSGISLIITLVLLLIACYGGNKLFSWVFRAVTNDESSLITALIIFFLVPPVATVQEGLLIVGVGLIAMASKYVLAVQKRHIFNPAAFGVFLPGLFGFAVAIWWVGSLVLLPLVVILGLLIVRKIRRFQLLFSFLIPAILTTTVFNLRNGLTPVDSLQQVVTSWPLIFFGTVMLTEPLTTPPQRSRYLAYGGLVGVLFGLQFQIGPLFASPELALITGNVFSFLISPRKKLFLHLSEKKQLQPTIYEFSFTGNLPFVYKPGQYLEWTLPGVPFDSRGNRRYFTIASSPTEQTVKLGVKAVLAHTSAFKQRLLALGPQETIVAGQLSGDFVLPDDAQKKLVFIAGGIGVTPFRSMVKYLLDKKEKRDIVFFYACSTVEEFVYQEVFDRAVHELGIRVVYVLTRSEQVPKGWKGETGHLTEAMLKKYVTDHSERTYYLSGPNAMVESDKKLLHTVGISWQRIVTDYFPGF